ncbi:MAG: DUF2255 family protein [Acidimicrobiales bacterium]
MSAWTDHELERIGDAAEVRLASRRVDGSLRPFTTMWVVRVGGELYVRSAGGPGRPWYRHAMASGIGRVQARGVDAEVEFADAAAEAQTNNRAGQGWPLRTFRSSCALGLLNGP